MTVLTSRTTARTRWPIAALTVALASAGGLTATAAAPAAATAAATPVAARAATHHVWHVGPQRALATPSAAAAVARDGDTVLIDAATYVGDVAVWTQDDLTLRGVGGMAHLQAAGRSAQGKAIWVIAGDRTRVDRIDFSGAVVPDGNGAGIRQEGTGLTLTRSAFRHNQDGLLTSADPASDIVIRRTRFVANGAGDGYTHNLYVGEVRSLTVTGSLLAAADVGHELKSRAARNVIVGNRITDGDATASYSIDLPNGGSSLIAGNVIIQGPRSENSALVSYGAEGLTHPSHTLHVVNNTFVNRRSSGTFVAVASGARAVLRNNLLVGPGELSAGGTVSTRADRRVGLGGFVRPAADDFRLRASSPAVDAGVTVARHWRPRWEYVHPARQVRRPTVGRIDLGAYERRARR